jgi:hypothetical protein
MGMAEGQTAQVAMIIMNIVILTTFAGKIS